MTEQKRRFSIAAAFVTIILFVAAAALVVLGYSSFSESGDTSMTITEFQKEITRSGFEVVPETVDKKIEWIIRESGKDPEGFKTALSANGLDFDYFKKKVKTRMLINGYLEENVFGDASTDADKQRLCSYWFNNAKLLAEIVYYDRDLERLVQQQSARGSCGG